MLPLPHHAVDIQTDLSAPEFPRQGTRFFFSGRRSWDPRLRKLPLPTSTRFFETIGSPVPKAMVVGFSGCESRSHSPTLNRLLKTSTLIAG